MLVWLTAFLIINSCIRYIRRLCLTFSCNIITSWWLSLTVWAYKYYTVRHSQICSYMSLQCYLHIRMIVMLEQRWFWLLRYGISLQTGIKDRHNSNLLGEHPHMVRDGCYNITHDFGVHARTLMYRCIYKTYESASHSTLIPLSLIACTIIVIKY